MKIVHSFCKSKIVGKTNKLPSFMLADNGNYLMFSDYPLSRYHGFIINQGPYFFKIIDDIKITDGSHLSSIISTPASVETNRGNVHEKYSLFENTMVFETNRITELEITFDCRKLMDNREFGRYYSIYKKGGKIVIKFEKKNHENESTDEGEYTLYVVIDSGSSNPDFDTEWQHWFYNLDFQRKSPPFEKYIYSLKPFKTKRLVISASLNEKQAMKENQHVCKNLELIKIKYLGHLQKIEREALLQNLENKGVRIAYCNAKNSLNSLIAKIDDEKNIFAGLPWFNQFWTRDTLISLGAVSDKKFVKQILLYYLKSIGKDGRLANRIPSTETGCADGIGWLFLRVRQNKDLFTKIELNSIKKVLQRSIKLIYENYFEDNLVVNDAQETWMDTIYNDEGRPGSRIEIQALMLNMIKFCHELTQEEAYQDFEKILKRKVKQTFWKKGLLKDGSDDPTVRPNIFIAYYAYPDLLSKKEWQECFDNSLKMLWLDWGGLATIDKNNPLFQPLYTGENNASYHRGDSWFWINNLAAICLADLNRTKYQDRINKILHASYADILWKGVVGHASELSSALEQKPEGCFCQAWSAALFVELVEKLY